MSSSDALAEAVARHEALKGRFSGIDDAKLLAAERAVVRELAAAGGSASLPDGRRVSLSLDYFALPEGHSAARMMAEGLDLYLEAVKAAGLGVDGGR